MKVYLLFTNGQKIRNIHPGEILREGIIHEYELKIGETAKMLGISRQMLNNIIHEKSNITPDMAYRIALVFSGTAEIWANMQMKYNLHIAAERAKTFKLKPFRRQLDTV